MDAFPKNVRAMLESFGVTQQQFGDSIGVSATTVNGWLKRGVQPQRHNLDAICSAHGVPHVTDENMRSSYATMMGEAGAPDSVVAGNMGHSDGSTKGRHYQRVTMRAKCMAADLLTDLLNDVECERGLQAGRAAKPQDAMVGPAGLEPASKGL